jgi:EAL domain-containing protein (putative c-di-GMP-specific phosphodiesterase class I)
MTDKHKGGRERRQGARPEGTPDIGEAMAQDEIEILFQPQYSAASGTLAGAEALAHWQYRDFGRIGGHALFAIAGRTGHAPLLLRHVAERALEAAANWPSEAGLRLSLNVTADDLSEAGFADEFAALLGRSGFPAERLTLEITEQVLVADLEGARTELESLAARGIRIALDDFGAGFCNFRYLKLLPLHYLKLDRSMVEGIAEDARDLAVLRGIVALAHALGLDVIAEGIETEEQRRIVAEEGIAFYQGFLKAQPMAVEEFAALATTGVDTS